MIIPKEKRDEMAMFSISTYVLGDKTYVKDFCQICGDTFEDEITPTPWGGIRIPRYCSKCVDDYSIINQNYTNK